MIVGITGTLGSGKGAVVDYLVKKGFKHFSVRDFLKKEILKRGLVVNRDSMVMVANDLRERFGSGYIIKELCERAKQAGGDSVVESIRAIGEVDSLREEEDSVLFAVDAPVSVRYARIVDRSSETDNVSFEEFVEQERREVGSSDPARQDLRGCIQRADYLFLNDSSLSELHRQVDEAIANIEERFKLNLGNNHGESKPDESGVVQNNPSQDALLESSSQQVVPSNPTVIVRPTWDEYFLDMLAAVAKRATCDRGKTSAIIVRDKHILVTGYVGSPIGLPHCDDVGHMMKKTVHEDGSVSSHCMRTNHAEVNAICQAAKMGISLEGGTLYCYMSPCYNCSKMIVNCGIKRVVCKKMYHKGFESEGVFRAAGIEFEVLDENIEKYENQ